MYQLHDSPQKNKNAAKLLLNLLPRRADLYFKGQFLSIESAEKDVARTAAVNFPFIPTFFFSLSLVHYTCCATEFTGKIASTIVMRPCLLTRPPQTGEATHLCTHTCKEPHTHHAHIMHTSCTHVCVSQTIPSPAATQMCAIAQISQCAT